MNLHTQVDELIDRDHLTIEEAIQRALDPDPTPVPDEHPA